jgi:hypothetical protein
MTKSPAFFAMLILSAWSCGVVLFFFISTGRALKKFDRLDSDVQKKLALMEYYMAAVRNLSKDDLALLGALPDEELESFNTIYDYAERMTAIREKIRKHALSAPEHSPRDKKPL